MDVKEKIKFAHQVMTIAGIFCAFTSILILLNFWHVKQNEPLESGALKVLIDRLASDPNDQELKQEIRNLDLLARKAYFTSQWQVKTGTYLLLFGAMVFGVALWIKQKLLSKIEKPVIQFQDEVTGRLRSQKWILITGGLFLALALGASFLSNDYLKLYNSDTKTVNQPTMQDSEQIEVITVSKIDSTVATRYQDSTVQNLTPELAQSSTVPVLNENKVNKTSANLSFEDLKKQHNLFRGVFGQGISYRKNIPVDWDGKSGKNIIWKVPLDKPGYNSPIIWDEKLFIAGGDKTSRVVYCYNVMTGKLIWMKEVTGIQGSPSTPPNVSDDTGLSASSMATDGLAVYAIFATGDIIAFDMSGNRLWARNLGVPDNHYGHSSSLLVWNNKLFVQYDTNKGGRLIAINPTNGEFIWDIKRANKISWSSPILIYIDGNYQIITSADPYVAAYDPETGKQIWAVDCMMAEVGPSPAFSDGLVFAANEYAKLVAIQPGKDAKILWENDEYLPEASSPVAYQGLLYLATSYGVIVCYDTKTGEKYWEHEADKGFFSSPMVADGKLYIIDLSGIMHIFKTGKEKIIIAEPALGESTFATPAFTDGRIFIRGEKNLYCIGNK